jgi:hypothetical protein
MFECTLCGKKLKTSAGLSIHLARTHNIRGIHGRISLKSNAKFFPLLKKKRWTKAEKLLKKIKQNTDLDDWIKGYLHALNGMIVALKTSHSKPEPYIIRINKLNNKKLQKIKEHFTQFADCLGNKREFDAAYFQAWEDFTLFLIKAQN